MNTAVVGAARVVFGADTSDFDRGAHGVEGTIAKLIGQFQSFEARLKRLGAGVTLGITVPFAAMVAAVDKGAGSFESQMKKVEAALDNVSGGQLKALSDQARDLGPKVGKGATEAAEGIEALGLAGVSTADILGGGLKATLDLAAAGMVDTSVSASLVTDVFGQFHKTAADLPDVVKNVVGALDASKFGFTDFQLAVSQGGGVAAAAGVSFLDFSTAIAATSAQFSSGSDAGTSFKTYIQSLTGNSDDAKFAMKKLGISFFDAEGRMKPLAEQAQILRKALGGLSDQSKTDALKTIFGSDAARTAIGLMEQGRKGFEDLQKTVAGGDVEAKIAKRLEGSAAAGQRIAAAWESVKIAIGDTGLLDAITAIKNGFARMLEAIAHAPPALLNVAAVFTALSAALGPLLLILGNIGAYLLARFVSGFGILGRILALVISPVTTIIGMLGEAGLARVLGMLVARFAALLGPIGWAVAAFVAFKDQIGSALQQTWDKIVATLGPSLEAIIAKVQGIFGALSGGPIGTAFAFIITALGGLADVIGTVIGGVLLMFGEVLVRVLGVAAAAFTGFVDVIKGAADIVNALLTGDFAGAWDAVKGIVGSVCDAIVAMAVALVPDMEAPLRAVYEGAKAWLSDGFSSIGSWMATAVQGMVDYVASAFPNVVAAAKGVYEGVKGWLVDKFGSLVSWIGTTAKWIGDQYQAMKAKLGFGAASSSPDAPAPPQPKPVKAPPVVKRTVDLEQPKKTRGGKGRKGRDTTYDSANRDELRLQAELEAARTKGDHETEQRIQDRLALEKQVEAYQRTGLSIEQARAAAQRDLADIQAARVVAMAREIADEQASVALDVAHLDENTRLEDSLNRQAEIKRRIAFYYAQTHDLVKATQLAEADQKSVDDARARERQRWFEDDAQDRAVRLAQLRGDTDEEVRQAQRVVDVRKRARDLQQHGMDEGDATAQANAEWTEEEKARQTGVFRETFKDGVRAALDGDLSGWIQNWWKDRVAKGMEQALNSLSDLIASLFSKIGKGAGSDTGEGGILGSIAGMIGKAFGGSSGTAPTGGVTAAQGLSNYFKSSPGFATGGSFKVGGMSGIDRNLVSMRLTKGERVDITPANDAGPVGGTMIHQTITFSGAIDLATKTEALRFAEAARQSAVAGVAEANRRRG